MALKLGLDLNQFKLNINLDYVTLRVGVDLSHMASKVNLD
jgi:hypothetical protein